MADYNIQMSILNSSGSYDNLNPVTLLNNISDWADYIYSKTELPNIIAEQVSEMSYPNYIIGTYFGTQNVPSYTTDNKFLTSSMSTITTGFQPKFLIIQSNNRLGIDNDWVYDVQNVIALIFPYRPLLINGGSDQPWSITTSANSFSVRNVAYYHGGTAQRTALNKTGTTYYYIAMG